VNRPRLERQSQKGRWKATLRVVHLLVVAALGILGLGCRTVSLDLSPPQQEVLSKLDVLEGEIEGASNGTLVLRPAEPGSDVSVVFKVKNLAAKWHPIIDMGVDFSDIERHPVEILWHGPNEQFSSNESVKQAFNLKYLAGPSVRQRLTLNLAGNPAWRGTVTAVKVMLPKVSGPVGIDFVRFPSAPLLSVMMPFRTWFGLNKRVFLAYLPFLIVMVLSVLNIRSAVASARAGNGVGLKNWKVSGWAKDASWQVLFWGLCLVFAANAVFPFDFFPYLKFPIAGVYVLLPETILALLVLLGVALLGPGIARLSAPEWAFMAFFGAALLSIKNASAPDRSLLRVIYYLLPAILFMALARCVLSRRPKLAIARRFSIAVLLVASWVAFHAVIEGLLDHNYLLDTFYRAFAPIYVEYTLGMPVASSFTDPSVLGSFLVMCLPLALFFALHEKRSSWLGIFGLVSTGLIAIALVYSCSYGSLVAVVAAVGIYFLRMHKKLLLGLFAAGVVAVVVAAVLMAPQYKQYLADVRQVDGLIRQGHLTQDEIVELAGERLDHTLLYSVNQRVDGGLSALRMMRDHPVFGIGIGNFEAIFDEYYRKNPETLRIYKVPDNVLFTILAETGILGLLAFLVFVATVVRASLRALRATKTDRYWNSYVWAVCVAIVGFGVNCLAYDGMFWFSPSFAFWAVLGMFLPLASSSTAEAS